jgi:hypothetical protein
MTRDDVTKAQAAKLSKALYPPTNYFARLRKRMVQRGFPLKDPLFLLVNAAYEALLHLAHHVHYLSCDGVGAPRRQS